MTHPNVPAALQGIGERAQYGRSFFGHPRGLSTLFFTERRECCSQYGLRARTHASSRLLILLSGVTA